MKNWSADTETIVVLRERRFRGGEEVPGVKFITPKEAESRTMKLILTGA